MPESTDDPIEQIRAKVAHWTLVRASGVMFELADVGFLLAAYDKAVARVAAGAAIEDAAMRGYRMMENARDRAEARAAAAEAAVQRVREIEPTDRGFVRVDDPETTRWMQGWDECLAAVAAALGPGSAGQPVDMGGKDDQEVPPHRAESHLPADPTYVVRDMSTWPLPTEVWWTPADEVAYQARKNAGFPTSYYEDPPFTPVASTQFVSGFQATTHAIEGGTP